MDLQQGCPYALSVPRGGYARCSKVATDACRCRSDDGEPALQPVQTHASDIRLRGGFQALMNGFLPLLRGDLLLQADVERVSPLLRTATLKDGRRFRYDTLISTLPLPVLIASMGDEAPAEVRRAASELRHVSIRCVNLGIARPHVTDKHWVYFPEDTVFHRVFMQGNASPHCNPPGGFGLTCEISYSPSKPLPATGAALTERCIRDCVRVGLLEASDAVLTSNQVDMPYAYVIYDHGRAGRVARFATGWRNSTSSWPDATANGSITTPITRSSPARRPRKPRSASAPRASPPRARDATQECSSRGACCNKSPARPMVPACGRVRRCASAGRRGVAGSGNRDRQRPRDDSLQCRK